MEMLRDVGLEALWHRPARLLSFGQRKLLELARALVSRPQLLLLDEPASGLSPVLRQFVDVVLRYGEAHGMAIVLIEHVIKLVHEVCARVTVLEQGQVIATGTPAEIQHHPQVLQAYLGQQMPGGPRYARQHTARRVWRWCRTDPGHIPQSFSQCPRGAGRCRGGQLLRPVASVAARLAACACRRDRGPAGRQRPPGNRRCCAPCQGWCARVEGTVLFAGQYIQGRRPERLVRRGLIHVPQGRDIFPYLTVGKTCAWGRIAARIPLCGRRA